MRVAIYCRKSNHAQDCDRQEFKLREYAQQHGHTVVDIFRDLRIGTKQRKKVLKLARANLIELVLVTDLSHWGKSASDLAQTVRELDDCSVSLICLNDFNLNPGNIHRDTIFGLLDLFGKFDDELLSEQAKFEKSYFNKIEKINWSTMKLIINILFAFIAAFLLLRPETSINGLLATVASVVISNVLNSLDLVMVPRFKRPKF